MQTKNTGILISELEEISKLSHEGMIEWARASSSTFQWIQGETESHYVVSIQKANAPRNFIASKEPQHKLQYLFQVSDKQTKKTIVSISTTDRPEYYNVLEDIYQGAEIGMDMRAKNILAKLISKNFS